MAATDIDEPGADRTGTGGADVDPSQARAIEEPTVPLAVLAGPGSGKTRVLARRIAHQVATGRADSERVLAVTFTRKAAGELNTRLGATNACEHVTAGTFHALSLALLRRWYEDRGRGVPTLLERKGRILGPLLGGGAEGIAAITPIAAEIEWAKARCVPPDTYVQAVDAVERPTPRPATEVADIYRRYEQQKRRGDLMDFDDLILRCALRMENDPDFAAATRWRFRHLFVDEFQDVSPAQFRLLRAWLGDRTDLFVVGDPDQAIFSFTGADPSYLLHFADHFPGAVVVNLEHSYRCPPQILAPARRLLDGPTLDGHALDGRAPEGQAVVRTLRSSADDGPAPALTEYDDAEAEAEGVAASLMASHGDGRRWSDLAVLYRTNAQSALFEEAFARHGIPVRLRGARRFLERAEVRADLARLRASTGSLRERLDELGSVSSSGARRGNTERAEHTEALIGLGGEYLRAEGGGGSLDGFVAFLTTSLQGDSGSGEGDDAVELVTFHRSKGLEWHTVFITGVESGYVPISHAKSHDELAEERRLFYVACTRAQHALHITWATRRAFGTREVTRRPGPFLVDMGIRPGTPGSKRSGSSSAGRPPATRVDELRAALRAGNSSGDPDDDALAEDLREWRLTRSRAAGVPAYVVFADRTLAEVVVDRPTTHGELLAVSGIGPVKAERFGPEILDIVERHTGTRTQTSRRIRATTRTG